MPTPAFLYKGKALADCTHAELIQCIQEIVSEVHACHTRLAIIAGALEQGSGFHKLVPEPPALPGKRLPPLAAEGRGGMKP